jgi:hypothetical protein
MSVRISLLTKEAPVPTILVQINDVSSDFSINKRSSIVFVRSKKNGSAPDGRPK